MGAVVVGYVDRPEGWAAVEAATREACLRESRLIVVHSGSFDPATEPSLRQRIEQASHNGGDPTPSWEFRALQIGHHVVDDLVAVVEEVGAALLVIGIRRRSSVGKFVMGSDAQRILMLAQCPVLAVKAAASE